MELRKKQKAAAEQKASKPRESVSKIVPETSAVIDVILPAADTSVAQSSEKIVAPPHDERKRKGKKRAFSPDVDLRSPSALLDSDLPFFGVDEVIAKRLREEEPELPEMLVLYLAAKSPHRETDVQKFDRLQGQLVDQMNLTRKGQEQNEALRSEKVALEAAKEKAAQENANLKKILRGNKAKLEDMGELKRDMMMLQVEMTKTRGIVLDLTKANHELRLKNMGLEMEKVEREADPLQDLSLFREYSYFLNFFYAV